MGIGFQYIDIIEEEYNSMKEDSSIEDSLSTLNTDDWRDYVPEFAYAHWGELTDREKKLVFIIAKLQSDENKQFSYKMVR